MTQIKHIARFTSPAKLMTPKEEMTHPIDKALAELDAQRTTARKQFLDTIVLVLKTSDQPLSAVEVAAWASQKLGRYCDPNTVRLALKELAAAGLTSHRTETMEERKIRAGGGQARSLPAQLHWAPAGTVPARTVTEAIDGVRLRSDYTPRRSKKAVKAIEASPVELIEVSPLTDSLQPNPMIDYLIEKMVAARTADLEKELADTKQELQKLKDFLKSAL